MAEIGPRLHADTLPSNGEIQELFEPTLGRRYLVQREAKVGELRHRVPTTMQRRGPERNATCEAVPP